MLLLSPLLSNSIPFVYMIPVVWQMHNLYRIKRAARPDLIT